MQIFFLSTKRNRQTIDRFLSLWGATHFWDILPISYESLITRKKFPTGLYIFSDLELLRDNILQQAIRISHHVVEQGSPILNCPGVSLTRFPLLTSLFEQQLNVFNIFRATEDYSAARYPVFLRKTDDHDGPQSALLSTPTEVDQALTTIQSRQENLQEWLVTEFCNTADAEGVFRKYSTFIIGETLIPRHLFFGTSWVQKTAAIIDQPAYQQEEHDFQRSQQFNSQLLHIFRTAHINYGRIDFGVLNGKIQTWEINTNPSILTPHQVLDNPRLPIHRFFFHHFSQAIQTYIDNPRPALPRWACISDRTRSVLHWCYQKSRHNNLTAAVKKTSHALLR